MKIKNIWNHHLDSCFQSHFQKKREECGFPVLKIIPIIFGWVFRGSFSLQANFTELRMAWFMSRRCGMGWDVPPQDTRNGGRKKRLCCWKDAKSSQKGKESPFQAFCSSPFLSGALKKNVLSFFPPPEVIHHSLYLTKINLKINSWKMKFLFEGPYFQGCVALFLQGSRDKSHKRQGFCTKKPRIWAILSQAQAMQRDPPQSQHFQPLAKKLWWNVFTLPETNSFRPWKWMVGIRSFPIGFRPIFRGEPLVSGRVRNRILVDCFFFPGKFSREKYHQKWSDHCFLVPLL